MTNTIASVPPTPVPSGAAPTTDQVLGANKAILSAALAEMGATLAVIDYSGSGDEGAIQSVRVEVIAGRTYESAAAVSVFVVRSNFEDGGWRSAVELEQQEIESALLEFADRAVDQHHPGYCNGDGGEGEVIFSIADGCARIEHRDFYTESNCTETDL